MLTSLVFECQMSYCSTKAGIPPGKSDASDGIGPKHIVTSTSGFSARCRPMRPIFLVEFQLNVEVAKRPCLLWERGSCNAQILLFRLGGHLKMNRAK